MSTTYLKSIEETIYIMKGNMC